MEIRDLHRAGIIVTSDRVFNKEMKDESGPLCRALLERKGYTIVYYNILPNDESIIEKSIYECIKDAEICITIGGTGPTPKDKTIEVASKLADKRLPGFGEIFRFETYLKRGLVKALPTRTDLFIIKDKILLCLPGSTDAVELGMRLFLEAADHLLDEVKRIDRPHKLV